MAAKQIMAGLKPAAVGTMSGTVKAKVIGDPRTASLAELSAEGLVSLLLSNSASIPAQPSDQLELVTKFPESAPVPLPADHPARLAVVVGAGSFSRILISGGALYHDLVNGKLQEELAKAFLFYVYEGGSESSLTELVADPCLVAAVDRFITGDLDKVNIALEVFGRAQELSDEFRGGGDGQNLVSVLDATPILAFDSHTQSRVTRAFDFVLTLWTGKTEVMSKFMTAHRAAFLSTFMELDSMKIFGPLVSVEKVAGICKQVQNVIFRVALAIRTGAPTPMNASLEASLIRYSEESERNVNEGKASRSRDEAPSELSLGT